MVDLHVDREQAERGQVAGIAGNDADRHPDDVDEAAQQQRTGAAERREREVPHIKSTLDGDLAQRVGLVPGGDLQNAGRGGDEVEAELGPESGQPVAGGVGIQRHLATQQMRRECDRGRGARR